MIINEQGYFLFPENEGRHCPSKGAYCRQCAYAVCCSKAHDIAACLVCQDTQCPHAPTRSREMT